MGVRSWLQGAVFWVMVAGVLGAALALGANRPISWLTLSAAALVLFGLQMLIDLTDRAAGRLWLRALPVALLYLGVIAWAVVQTLPIADWGWPELAHPSWAEAERIAGIPGPARITADTSATWQGILRYLAYAAVFWIAARAANIDRARHLIDVIALFSLGLALIGLVFWAVGTNPITSDEYYPDSVKASFTNRNAYAYHAGVGAMACLTALAFRLPAQGGRGQGTGLAMLRDLVEMLLGPGRWYLLGMVVILAAILLTGSRAGSAVTMIGIGLIAVLIFRRAGSVLRWVGLGVMMAMVGVLALVATTLRERLSGNDPAEDQRMVVYERTWQGIWDRFWTGHGLGAYEDAFRPYVPRFFTGNEWDKAHNSYLENAFELGLPAMAALTLALTILGWRIWAGLEERRRMRPLMAFGLAIFVSGALHALLDFSLQMPATAALFAVILGVSWSLARRENRLEKKRIPN